MSLHIRDFNREQDLEVWLAVRNQAWAEDPEFIPATIEDFKLGEQAPGYENVARFVAELDGPDGRHRLRPSLIPGVPTEKPSWAVRPVIPEARRKGVATALARRVLEHLSEKGMEQVEAQALAGMPGACELLTSLR